jgi:hypothetical protein
MVMVAAGLAVLGGARAQEAAEAEASLSVDALSAYVWRGQVLNDEAVLQPSLTVAKGGFSINWWGSLNLTDNVTEDAGEFSEHDIGVTYASTCPFTGADVSLGVVRYDFPNAAVAEATGVDALVKSTEEAQLTVGFGDCPAEPKLLVAYDFGEAEGFYGKLSISHSFEANKQASVDLGASVAYATADYNAYYFGVDDDALNDATVSLAVPIALTDALSVSPTVTYAKLLDSDIQDGAEAIYGDDDKVFGGVNLSYTF